MDLCERSGLLSYPRALLSYPSQGPAQLPQGPAQRRLRFLLERRRRSARLPWLSLL